MPQDLPMNYSSLPKEPQSGRVKQKRCQGVPIDVLIHILIRML